MKWSSVGHLEQFTRNDVEPEWAAALEALGFRRVGWVHLVAEGDTTSHFEAEDARFARTQAELASPVFASPDGTALAELSTWFDRRASVRLRTALEDGRVAETTRQWGRNARIDPEQGAEWLQQPVPLEMVRTQASGRSIRVLDTDEAAELWAFHQQHVADLGGRPRRHDAVDQWLLLASHCLGHDLAMGDTVGLMLTWGVAWLLGAAALVLWLGGFGLAPAFVGLCLLALITPRLPMLLLRGSLAVRRTLGLRSRLERWVVAGQLTEIGPPEHTATPGAPERVVAWTPAALASAAIVALVWNALT